MAALIINTFELVAPQPQGDRDRRALQAPQTQEQEQKTPPPVRPEDVELIQHHFINRRLRLWAD